MHEEYIVNYLEETGRIAQMVSVSEINKGAGILMETKKKDGRIFILGVGGSAANASHAVNDFRKISGMEAYTPTDNVAEFSARANDDGWASTFAEWLKTSKLSDRDTILVLSVGGGNQNVSVNIVNALKLAKERGTKIISVISRDGGYAGTVSDACIRIPVVSDERLTPHAEEWQGVIWHLLVNAIAG